MKKFLCSLVLSLAVPFAALAQQSFAPLAERVMPSVVNISTQLQDTQDAPNVVNDLMFTAPDGRVALGSGFVISEDGYIITNRHVIERASKIVVTANDNVYEGALIGEDVKTDLALIKIEPENALQPVEFGDSDSVQVGDWILAVGNPFGLGSSVTAGIISAKSRDIDSGPYDNYLQTDASINQGNSGGPMFDMNGLLIGINTAIFSTTGNSVGVGFALPANEASKVIEQLLANGKVTRSWLGIEIKNGVDGEGNNGLLISSFQDEELAQRNNLQTGDIILELNGVPVDSAKSFSSQIAQTEQNTSLELKIWRNGETIVQSVETALMPEDGQAMVQEEETQPPVSGDYYPDLGVRLDNLQVTAVDEMSDALIKGVNIGDIIRKVDTQNVFTHEDLQNYIEGAKITQEPLRLDMEDVNGNAYFVELPMNPNALTINIEDMQDIVEE